MKRQASFFTILCLLALSASSVLAGLDSETESEPPYNADPRFDLSAPGGLPVTPGDTVILTATGTIVQRTVFYVDACFYQSGVLQGRVTQYDHTITINTAGEINGQVNDLNFGSFFYCDEINIIVGARLGGGPVFEWQGNARLAADYDEPIAPALDSVGLVLLLLVVSGVLFKFSKR